MIKVAAILVVLVTTATGFAAEDPARASMAAAIEDARAQLRAEIMAARVVPGLSVQQFLEQTESPDALDAVIARARQIGGPRWIDSQTCQVKLEVGGDRVAYAIVSTAAVRPAFSPIPAKALELRLAEMKQRTFIGTGTAISASKVAEVRPLDPGGVWLSVSDDDRGRAVDAARQDAVRHLLDDIRPIQVEGGPSMRQLLEREQVQRAVDSWLATRPVTQVKFQEDLSVELTVAAPPEGLLDTVVNSARSTPGGETLDERSIEQLKLEFAKRVSAAVGRAGVKQAAPATEPARRLELPRQPPAWVWGDSLSAEGTAPRQAVTLFTTQNAGKRAAEALREQINALQLTSQFTLGDAAKQDPAVAEAIDRVMLRTQTSSINWMADGSARVRIVLSPSLIWNELQRVAER